MFPSVRTCGWVLVTALVGSSVAGSLWGQEPVHVPIRAQPAAPSAGEVAHVRMPVRMTGAGAPGCPCPDCVTHVPIRPRVGLPSESTVVAAPEPGDVPLAINLPTALYLAGTPSADVLYAQQRTQVA